MAFQTLQASGDKLAALFSSEDSAANVTLQFHAPRAPRGAALLKAPAKSPAASLPAEATGANPGITFAGTCHLFRLYQGGYQAVNPPGGTGEDGSVGIVVMGTGEGDRQRILCYDKAKAQVMAVTISGELDVIPQPGLYLSLKDDQGVVWSLRFKSQEDLFNATRAIALARTTAWTAADMPTLVRQDALVGGDGTRQLTVGDSATIRYEAWLESPVGRGILGDPVPGDAVEADFTLGDAAVIAAWEEGVLGMCEGGVRWLIAPPHLAYGDEGLEEAGIPPAAVLIMRLHVDSVREGHTPLPPPPDAEGQGAVTIATAIKSLRPPSESGGEDDDEWGEEPVGGAEVVPGSAGAGGGDGVVELGSSCVEPEVGGVERGVGVCEGQNLTDDGHELSGDMQERISKPEEHGGMRNPMGASMRLPPNHVDYPAGHMRWGGEAGAGGDGVVYNGGGGYAFSPGVAWAGVSGASPVMDALAAQRRGQEELEGVIREVRGGVEEVRGKVTRLLEQGERKSAGAAELLMGQVLVDSIQKLVNDNAALRSDAVQLREKVQEGVYVTQQLQEEKRRLEQVVEEHTSQAKASAGGEGAEALKLQIARLQAQGDTTRSEMARLGQEVAAHERDKEAALADARELKLRCNAAEVEQAAAQERAEEAEAARAHGEAERKKLRAQLQEERRRWQEELEEERAGVDRNMKELRDTIRRLRVEGAGASQAELDELQAKLEGQAAATAAELQEALDAKAAALLEAEEAAATAQGEARAREREAIEEAAAEAARSREAVAALEAELGRMREAVDDKDRALAAAREEGEAGIAAAAAAAKLRIEKVKEAAKAQVPKKVKEVASAVYFQLEACLGQAAGRQSDGWPKEEILEMVLATLKAATLEVVGGESDAAGPTEDHARDASQAEHAHALRPPAAEENAQDAPAKGAGVPTEEGPKAGVGDGAEAPQMQLEDDDQVGKQSSAAMHGAEAALQGEEDEDSVVVEEAANGMADGSLAEDAVRPAGAAEGCSICPDQEEAKGSEEAGQQDPQADETDSMRERARTPPSEAERAPQTLQHDITRQVQTPAPAEDASDKSKASALFGEDEETEGTALFSGGGGVGNSAARVSKGRRKSALFEDDEEELVRSGGGGAGIGRARKTPSALFGDDDDDDEAAGLFQKGNRKNKGEEKGGGLFGEDDGGGELVVRQREDAKVQGAGGAGTGKQKKKKR